MKEKEMEKGERKEKEIWNKMGNGKRNGKRKKKG